MALTRQLEDLRGIYDDQVVSESHQLEAGVRLYFKDCWEVKDWLRNDPGAPSAVRAEVDRLTLVSAPLRLGGALGHGGSAPALSGGMAIQARCFRIHDTNTAVVVSYWSQARWRQTIDALDLAERCHRTWSALLD